MLDLLWTVVIGFVAGVLAKFIMPGKQNIGFVMTTMLGVTGALVATWLGRIVGWYDPTQSARFIGAIVGAIIILILYGFIKKKSTT
jgi:uncharacterized membrane protein YeaQ/YmgE (transglycosylase-associated protein family)